MLCHLFIAGRRKCVEEGEEVTVKFEHILRCTVGAETEPFLGFQIVPSITFAELWNQDQENFFLQAIHA